MRLVIPAYVVVVLLATACGTRDTHEFRSDNRPSTSIAAANSIAAGVATPKPFVGGAAGVAGEASSIGGVARTSVAAAASDGAGPSDVTRPDGADSAAPAMLIRTGQASVQVDSLGAGIAAVRELARHLDGYVADVSMRAGGAQTHAATLELKIPSARFDDALEGLKPVGRLDSVNVSTEDVGEEYVDVTARVENARRLEQRLVTLLATRTGKLSDVLAVERELARVREEIERYEGRRRYLRAHAAFSTLWVTVHEPFPVVGEHGSGNVMVEAARDAWRNFVRLLAAVVASMGIVIPIGALGVALWLLGRRGRREAPKAA